MTKIWAFSSLVLLGLSISTGCQRPAAITITDKDLPFEHKLTLAKGQSAILTLPNGKNVAFWCEGGTLLTLLARTAPTLNWAEKPFQQLDIDSKRMPDGSVVLTDWKSYIRQGSVTTWSDQPGSERELFVEKYRITLTDCGDVNGVMPVTVQVRLATEREMLHGDAEREHFVKQLKSSKPNNRLAAIQELFEMAEMGSIYAGDPNDMIPTMRPLTLDPDARVQEAAERYLCQMGDEKTILALVTPEPRGPWRTAAGAHTIADWCVRHKCPEVCKHVLTFFQSKDQALREFAITFFARNDDPASKAQMLAALKSESPEIRAKVIPVIRFLCTPQETADQFVSLLHDSSKQVVLAALVASSWVNRVIPPAEFSRLLKGNDPAIREAAAYGLDCCPNPEVIAPLLTATRDPVAAVRAQAAVSLGRIGTPKAYDRLIELLTDPTPAVRENAVNGLRWLRDTRAIPHIQKLLQDEKDRDTRNMAECTIRELK